MADKRLPPLSTTSAACSSCASMLFEDAAIGRVVVHDQHAAAPCSRHRVRRLRLRHGRVQRDSRTVKWNVLPLPTVALDPDPPAHHRDQLRRDRQAQARAAVLARRRAVRLGERLEDRPCLSAGMPMPVSRDHEMQHDLSSAGARPSRRRRRRPRRAP